MASAGDGGDDDDLWAQETLKFASAGLAAAQHLRESKKKAPPPLPPSAPPLLQSSDFASTTKATVGSDEGDELVRDADGDLAGIDNADDYVTFEGGDSDDNSDDDSEDDSEDDGDRGLRRVKKLDKSYIKLPEIRGVGLSGVRDIDMEDVRQQAMLAQLRRREANYLDTVRSLNITNLQMHAREFARTPIPENTKCEIHDWAKGTDPIKIALTGTLEFLDTEEERSMFHALDAKPYLDKVNNASKLPDWAQTRLEALNNWLAEAKKKVEEQDVNLALDMNEFVGWTYLYRFMNFPPVSKSLNTLVNYLMPNGMFVDAKPETEGGTRDPESQFAWFGRRKEFLEELDKIMPSSSQMKSFDKERGRLEQLKQAFDAIKSFVDTGELTKKVANVLSYTWNYLFFLLFYRQIIVHEFFMFCTWKKMRAPNLEGASPDVRKLVNSEESEDDIMHTYYATVLNKFALFRDVLMGAKDPFTFHLQQYLTLSHERIRISHERNMRRSEDVVYKTATGEGGVPSTLKPSFVKDLLEQPFFDNRPRTEEREVIDIKREEGFLESILSATAGTLKTARDTLLGGGGGGGD